jgi:hypothetical protein
MSNIDLHKPKGRVWLRNYGSNDIGGACCLRNTSGKTKNGLFRCNMKPFALRPFEDWTSSLNHTIWLTKVGENPLCRTNPPALSVKKSRYE